MRSNFELWKKGNLPMFITSFTINGESGADNILILTLRQKNIYPNAVMNLQEPVLNVCLKYGFTILN